MIEIRLLPRVVALASALIAWGCGRTSDTADRTVVTFSGSAVGAEARVLALQLEEFEASHPGIRVRVYPTPDAADQRHQLYVQWLNARTSDPDVLQLDVVWTPEFAAAGWILPLDGFAPDEAAFFPATIRANRWRDSLYAIPWFVDVGLLYWRTDLLDAPPSTYAELEQDAQRLTAEGAVPYGFVWQGARYEGLMTVFLEYLRAFGGRILDDEGSVALDSEQAIRALERMRLEVDSGIAPRAVLTWQEEQTRLAFQAGDAALMRNWPYALPLLQDSATSKVAGRVAVAPPPAGPGGVRASALGGQELAINAHSDHPSAAWQVVAFLTAPGRMLERAELTGQYPPRQALFTSPELAASLAAPLGQVRAAIESAVPRPVTPLYSELSGIVQVWLHRALTGQTEPDEALHAAAVEARALMKRRAPPPASDDP